MRVIKVLNNSLVLALDNAGQESILMGKGIGFHKSIGYEFQESEIEKVFVLKDKEVSRNIIRLAAETDSVFFELAKAVIDYAIEQFDMKLMDHIYLSLTDHLSFAARRVREGIVLQNFYTLEMKKFNPQEFQVGEYAVKSCGSVWIWRFRWMRRAISPFISSTPSSTIPITVRIF